MIELVENARSLLVRYAYPVAKKRVARTTGSVHFVAHMFQPKVRANDPQNPYSPSAPESPFDLVH
jgi:hypothetical protein